SGADVVAVNGPEMQILDNEKLLLPLTTPIKKDIAKAARFPTWAGLYLNVFVAAWNTKDLAGSEAPGSWEEVLTSDLGKMAMELGDWDWFATLVTEHFMAEEGMTEDEAVELFRKAARKSVVVDGHTTMAELLAAGEFSVVSSAYQHRIPRLRAEGAPIAWEPAVEPIIIRPNGIGIHRDTDQPATALLFVEYGLTDAQKLFAKLERTPANSKYGGVPNKYDMVTVDLEGLEKQRKKWEGLYESVVRESGADVVKGE
ncbi:MAG: ABC transporter substrate-binding protein, partial [Micromonosporaceae bacterium]